MSVVLRRMLVMMVFASAGYYIWFRIFHPFTFTFTMTQFGG